jgi:Sulfotransferase family
MVTKRADQRPSARKKLRLRQILRNGLFHFVRKISETDDARAIWANTLRGQLAWQPYIWLKDSHETPFPYDDLGTSDHAMRTALRSDVIIITGRFRSGSTLLWNLFRNIEGVTAFYEPFNERRWFDPRTRGDRVDPTHINADEYWREYEGLEVLNEYYCEEWIERHLYMDASFWAPKMKRYVELMIEKAPGRPVLQFNRIDLRLPWFRKHFPNALIVHLYRHPRDQWCSTLMDPDCFSKDGTLEQFAGHDKFYLQMWGRDLKYHFPFLDEVLISHPYQLFYYIWKISYLFGRAYAHYSIAFEDILENSDDQLTRLLRVCRVDQYNIDKLKSLIESPIIGKWKTYADEEWFRRQESICETTMADFFAAVSRNKERDQPGGF